MARFSVVIALSAVTIISCISAPTSDPFRTDRRGNASSRSHPDLMVRVENNHFDPVVISAVWGQSRYFLGEIQPGERGVFQIPGHLLDSQGDPQLLADPRGRAIDLLSEPIGCEDAHWVHWRLKRNLMPSRPVILGL